MGFSLYRGASLKTKLKHRLKRYGKALVLFKYWLLRFMGEREVEVTSWVQRLPASLRRVD